MTYGEARLFAKENGTIYKGILNYPSMSLKRVLRKLVSIITGNYRSVGEPAKKCIRRSSN